MGFEMAVVQEMLNAPIERTLNHGRGRVYVATTGHI
jgi:hypothetical protein